MRFPRGFAGAYAFPAAPQNMRGSASPKGEARRECAAKAKRSDCRGREDYGWGWAGGVIKPNQATNPPAA